MTHVCEWPTAVRLLNVDTEAELYDFHDPDNGVDVAGEIILPPPNKRQRRRKYARVGGSFGIGARLPDDGTLIVPIVISGATWGQKETRYLAMYAAIDSLDELYVETELSGVKTRWYTDAPVDVLPAPVTPTARARNRLEYELRFLVQPDPDITIA
jgi:hypothetical protein